MENDNLIIYENMIEAIEEKINEYIYLIEFKYFLIEEDQDNEGFNDNEISKYEKLIYLAKEEVRKLVNEYEKLFGKYIWEMEYRIEDQTYDDYDFKKMIYKDYIIE